MGRIQLFMEDGTVLRVYPQVVEDLGLCPGMELSEERLTVLSERAGQISARMRAVRIVSASSVSRQELENRLIRKGEEVRDAQAAVAWMEELRLVDDRQTAAQIVRHGAARGYGRARVKQMLYEKRIPRELWEEALSDFPVQDDAIKRFLHSRLAPGANGKEIKRAADALLRRGHSWAEIRRCLTEWEAAAELPEDTE